MNSLHEKLLEHYDFKVDEKGNDIYQVKTNEDFPYRIRKNKKDQFVLDQQFAERSYMKAKWYQQKVADTKETLLLFIIKRHNKSCNHMTNWKTINI